MSSSNPLLNSSGLTPEESKKLPERTPSGDEGKVIQAIRELYTCQPNESTYDIYARDAVFHDPIGIAEGIDSIKAQFNGLAKICAKAQITQLRVLNNPSNLQGSTLLIDQDVDYHLRESSSSGIKKVNSLLIIERNDQGQVTRHTEEWDHCKTATAEDGFLGKMNDARKRLTASIVDSMVDKKPPSK